MDIDALTRLSIALSKSDALEQQLTLICRAISEVLPHANRISLWKFCSDKSAIECVALLDHEEFSIPSNLILSRSTHPSYFDAILAKEHICASDARNHPDTSCFNKDYFKEKDIYSLLDYVFNHEFAPFGIICCESAGHAVEWLEDDLNNLRRAARIVSVFSDMDE